MVSFLQEYAFVLKHKAGVENRAVDVLSRVVYILTSLAVQVTDFDQLIKDYSLCKDFSIIYSELLNGQRAQYLDFSIHDGYLFKGTSLCMPNTSLREQVAWELHAEGVACHFGCDKTIVMVEDCFYWPGAKIVVMVVYHCLICRLAKGRKKNTSLYTPLPVPHIPWEDLSMDFVV